MNFHPLILIIINLLFSFDLFAWGLKELGEEMSVPVTTDAKYAFWIGSGITFGLYIFKDELCVPFQKSQVRNQMLGSYSQWGDLMGQLIPNAFYVGWMAVAGYNGDPDGYRRSLGMFKATAYSSFVTTFLKYTVREPRPINRDWRNSFPSGHTTTGFAFSGYAMAEHEYWIGIPSLALSTFIGYSRIQDNMHWLYDVVAGATIGWTYGWGISRFQTKKNSTTFILPIHDSQKTGVAIFSEF